MVELTAISLLTGIYLYSLMFFLISSLLSLQWGLLKMAGPAGLQMTSSAIAPALLYHLYLGVSFALRAIN